MRSPVRQIILIALVATALCADRAICALPAVNHTVADVAGRVVSKLATSFRRTASNYRTQQFTTASKSVEGANWAPASSVPAAHFAFSPFQFRLPPPMV
ncbi:MAG TPA: hypothetical protein VG722_03790 [Tepidisphaeraceae bacterium]|nr:hypothetical protein [Tepidisphaeraceae bacterium]